MVFLGPVIIVPVVVMQRGLDGWWPRVRVLAVAGLVTIALLAPWTVRNLTTFHDPVLFSNNQDSVIAGANCPTAYYGAGIGSWDPFCNTKHLPQHVDQSVVFSVSRERGIRYAQDHLSAGPRRGRGPGRSGVGGLPAVPGCGDRRAEQGGVDREHGDLLAPRDPGHDRRGAVAAGPSPHVAAGGDGARS